MSELSNELRDLQAVCERLGVDDDGVLYEAAEQLERDQALIKDIAGCCSIRSVTHLLDRYYKSIGLNHYPGPANIRKYTVGGE